MMISMSYNANKTDSFPSEWHNKNEHNPSFVRYEQEHAKRMAMDTCFAVASHAMVSEMNYPV